MSNLVVKQINGGPTGVINAIINGNFGINQRGVSGTVTLASGVYGHDRWKAGASGCTYTFATVANVTNLTITAGTLIQVIEGVNLGSGTYTLSFAGTAQGKIGAGSFSGSGVTGTAVGGTNLNIEFNTGTVSLVQFELGSVATPFERRPFGAELALCQRYYYRTTSATGSTIAIGQVATTTIAEMNVPLPVPMRVAPTALDQSGTASNYLVVHGVTGTTCSVVPAVAGGQSSPNLGVCLATVASGLTVGQAAYLRSVTNGFLGFSAEL